MSDAPRVPSAWQIMEVVSRWQQRREELLADPELVGDEQVILAATAEGEKVEELLSRLIDAAIWCELRATEADDLHKALRDRRDRYEARKETIRQTIADLLDIAKPIEFDRKTGEILPKRHRTPFGSASLGLGPRSVVIIDEQLVPDDLCTITRYPRKTDIRERIDAGQDVPGAVLSNPAPMLRIVGPRKPKEETER